MPKDKSSQTVLVTGATGRQGGSVARALLKKGFHVRAFTRNLCSPAAVELHEYGVELWEGNFEDVDTIEKAAKKVDAVYVMTTSFEAGPEAEVQQGKNVIDGVKKAGVKHIILSSVASANQSTGIPHFDSKYAVEQHLEESGVPYTIIAPVAFMDNFISPMSLPGLRAGRISNVLPGDRTQQMIAVADIGSFAAAVIQRKDECLGMRYDIASEEITGPQIAEILTQVTGREITYVVRSLEEAQGGMPADLSRMYEWMLNAGYNVDILTLHERFPEVEWHTFESWAAGQDWATLLEDKPETEPEMYV
jgi:uncharacterized protein YbjT (DUF2867 family)